MNGGEVIAQIMQKQGVEFLFTLCGGHISPILVGAHKEGIRVVDVRQESTAVFAADGVSRLTGLPGVAVVTAGPGVTNSITAIKNAQMAQSPLVVFGGAPPTMLRGKGALQDIEQLEVLSTMVKWSASIQQNCDLVSIVEEAFDVAKSGVPGPVFIECPLDLLYDEELVRQWYLGNAEKPKNLVDRVTNWYMRRHVDKLFACSPRSLANAEEEEIVPFSMDVGELEKAWDRIKQARAPVMVLGSQVALRTEKMNPLAEQLKAFGMPVYLTGMARGLMGADHPLHLRHGRSRALGEADLVLIAGMPCDFRLNYGQHINNSAEHIAVNRSEADLKLNKKPDLAIFADPCTFLLELTAKYDYRPRPEVDDWIARLRERDSDRENRMRQYMAEETEYINPLRLCDRINTAMDENSVVVIDGGDFAATAGKLVKPRAPLCWLDAGPYGTLGAGAGFALAAKLVRPEAEVWLLYGDGAAGFSLMEFDTFVRHNIPVISVVGNDGGWSQIAREQASFLNDTVGTDLRYTGYHRVAEGLDVPGHLLDDETDIESVLQKAKTVCAQEGRPVLVNALIGKTDFRKGSI